MSEPNQREATERAAWRIANAFRLADPDSVSRLQLEIRAAIQSAMDHEREACAKIAAERGRQCFDKEDAAEVCAMIAVLIRAR